MPATDTESGTRPGSPDTALRLVKAEYDSTKDDNELKEEREERGDSPHQHKVSTPSMIERNAFGLQGGITMGERNYSDFMRSLAAKYNGKAIGAGGTSFR